MHKRQILPKEERKWLNLRERSYCVKRPIMAFPPYHSNHTHPLPPVYPMWGQSGGPMAGMQIWGSPGYPLWQPTAENWRWKPFPGVIFVFLNSRMRIWSFSSVLLLVAKLSGLRCRDYGYGWSPTCDLLILQMHADAWGCPVLPLPPPQTPGFPYSQVSISKPRILINNLAILHVNG